MRKLAAGLVVLLLNAAYLAARNDASLFYSGNVALHLILALAVGVAALVLLPRAWPRFPPGLRLALLVLGAGSVAGLALAITGATRPHYGLLVLHAVLGSLGALPVLFAITRVAFRGNWLGRAALSTAWVALVVALAAFAKEDIRPAANRIVNPPGPPYSMEGEGEGPKSPFFPSSARTNVGGVIPSTFFLKSEACGRCHRDIYEQWKSSVHHFSSFNNQWYRRSIEYMQDVVGTRSSKWCAGCHDHAVFFNGRFDRPIREQIDTEEAQAGLACTSCHSIVHVGGTMGQGDFTIEYPPLHDLAARDSGGMRVVHDYLLRLAPGPHRATFLKAFHREQTPEFCSACHKVHLDVPVNGYRWIRGFNEYDNWQASGVSGEGARSFYYPKAPQKCAECHMPLVASQDPGGRDGHVHSHRFPAANTAVPFVNQDSEQLRATQAFLQDGQVSVDLFGLVREEAPREAETIAPNAQPRLASTFAQGEESGSTGPSILLSAPSKVIAPLNQISPSVRRGESVRLEAVVRTRKVGHFFPGGTVDAYDCWVELKAVDGAGKVIFESGGTEDLGHGPVDPGAHFYRSLLLDDHGNPINKRNAWMARSVAYVHLIPPGAADTVHYRLRVPEDARDPIHLELRLHYRKFAWWNTQWAFAGRRDPLQEPYEVTPGHDDGRWLFTGDTSHVSGAIKAIPDIPTTTMASAEATLHVVPKGEALSRDEPVFSRSVRERWNDYGIGLLLQGDLKAAESAFLHVTEMDPDYVDGFVNVARARIQEGSLDSAEMMLEQALMKDPQLAKAHFFMGSVLKSKGRYDEALQHLRSASSLYPRDRVVLDEIGRILFLQRRYPEAIAAFARVLAIDPEDLQAHYTLMLCRRGLGDLAGAQQEQVLYERFKADEAAQFITGPYRQLHAEDNNERQTIHEHETARLSGAKENRVAQTGRGQGTP